MLGLGLEPSHQEAHRPASPAATPNGYTPSSRARLPHRGWKDMVKRPLPHSEACLRGKESASLSSAAWADVDVAYPAQDSRQSSTACASPQDLPPGARAACTRELPIPCSGRQARKWL